MHANWLNADDLAAESSFGGGGAQNLDCDIVQDV